MRSTRAMGATATLLAVLAAAGCGGGSSGGGASSTASHSPKGIASGEPAPPQTTTATSPHTSKSPTTKPTPTSSGTAAGAPGVPEPARQHTKAGAKAFASHYIDLINSTGVKPKTGLLEPLGLASCKSCDNYEGTVQYFVQHKQKYNGDEYSIKKIAVVGDSEAGTFVRVTVSQPKVSVVDEKGSAIQSYPYLNSRSMVFELSWTPGWRVRTIKGE